MKLEERVVRLERQNRVLLAALGGLVLVSAAARGGEVVRAERFEMVDGEGRVRAELGIDPDGSAGVFLRDEEGRVRGCLVHDESQTGMFALDQEGDIRVGAAQFAHGGGGFALHGPGGKGAAVLYLKESGTLSLYDAEGGVQGRWPE